MLRNWVVWIAIVVALNVVPVHALLHDVMILNDTSEQVGNDVLLDVDVITRTFLTALCHRSYAILVSRHVVENALIIKSSSEQAAQYVMKRINLSEWNIYTTSRADDYYLFIPSDQVPANDAEVEAKLRTELSDAQYKQLQEYVNKIGKIGHFASKDILLGFRLSTLISANWLKAGTDTPDEYKKILERFKKGSQDRPFVLNNLTDFFVPERED